MEAVHVPAFGQDIRDAMFFLDKDVAFTNHGSFGTVPKPVQEVQSAKQGEVERDPDLWYRWNLKPEYLKSCEAVANFVHAPSHEVVLVDNATSAVNIVLRSLKLRAEDGLLITSLTYRACHNAAKAVCDDAGGKLHILEIKLPVLDKESIIQLYREYLEQHPDVRMVLVDHITSPSALLMPVKEIVSVCHASGVRVMVDGAHTPGQVELRIKDIGADYYTGNLHKWLFCPRGCALLHVCEDFHGEVVPLVVSHSHFLSFQERFAQQGTRDYTPYCMAPTALEFFNRIGGLPAVSSYNQTLISWATEMLCSRWGEHRLPIPLDMRSPYLSLIHLPDCLGPPTVERKEELQELLFRKYKVMTVVDVVDREMWCRISTQIYNTKEDYLKLADAMDELIQSAKG